MRNLFHRFLILATLLPCSAYADFTFDVNAGWNVRNQAPSNDFMPATVPGTIHTDLFANGLIADPFIGTNEAKVQWVETKTWEYQTTFSLSKQQLRERHLELQFDGLDTYADVYLNETLVLTAEDMFLKYGVDIKAYAKKENTLRIVFHPAQELIDKNKAFSPIKKYPGGDRVFIRKAQYQFGWDWGPRFVTCGIWKPVRVVGWSDMRISDVVYKLDYLDKDTAFMTVDFTFEADKAGKYQFLVFQNDSGIYSDFYSVRKSTPEHLKITFRVAHPKLWWCNGMGDQPLYRFALATFRRKKAVVVSTVTGIRKIELSTDMLNSKGSFTFVLNDKPVFAMGSNWIPSDNFLPRVLNSKVDQQLEDMQALNMNMIRVWGGGIYESDHFYSKCDSLGLMVWQDLPFACSMYPYQTLDKDNVLTKEVTQNVRRIASHPSIAIWCGDNENKEGWFNWGWQREFGYSAEDSAKIYNDYFNYSLKFMGCVAQHDPFFPYVISSPQNGWGREIAYLQGDVHYWGVWWGSEPFSAYEDHTGRFVSEFGFQSAPSVHTFKEMGANTKFWFRDSTINAHQKHPTGFETIARYMNRDYGITPNSFDDYVYLTQVMQKDAMETAIESQRRNMPRCMGSLFWQYNDCWPVTSWSVQDYYGRKKLAWYELKRLYAPETVSIQETSDSVFVWVVMNSVYPRKIHLHVEWISFEGAKHFSDFVAVDPRKNSSSIYWRQSKAKLKEKSELNKSVLSAQLVNPTGSGYNIKLEANKLFGKPMEWNLPEENIEFTIYRDMAPVTMRVSSKTYQENVMIVCDDPGTSFSRNGFDILPGQALYVEINTPNSEGGLEESIRFITMNQLINEEKMEKKTELPD
jgi:beta-mannosidase